MVIFFFRSLLFRPSLCHFLSETFFLVFVWSILYFCLRHFFWYSLGHFQTMWSQTCLIILLASIAHSMPEKNISSRLPTLVWLDFKNDEALGLTYKEDFWQLAGSQKTMSEAVKKTEIIGYKNKTFISHLSGLGYDTYRHQLLVLKAFSCYFATNQLTGTSTYRYEECFTMIIKALGRANNTWIKENLVPSVISNHRYEPNFFFDNQFLVCIEEILVRGSTTHFDWIHRFYTKKSDD